MRSPILIAMPLALLGILASARVLSRPVRARRGSIVACADQRRRWLVAAWLVGIGALGCSFIAGGTAAFLAGAAGAGAVALVLALDIAALRDARIALRGSRLGSSVDFGLGDELRTLVETGSATYRDADRVVEEHRGSPQKARDALRRMIGADALLLVLALAALLLQAWPPPYFGRQEEPEHVVRRIRVPVYTDGPWEAAHLLGVDRAQKRAFVRVYATEPDSRWALDTIDLVSGERIERWEATPENARLRVPSSKHANSYVTAGGFQPIRGGLDADLARYATLAQSADGFWDLYASFAVSSDGEHVVYGRYVGEGRPRTMFGIEHYVTDRNGASTRRLDEKNVLSGPTPTFSPDGHWIAWKGGGLDPPGSFGWDLHVAKVGERGTRLATGVTEFAWSADGRSILALRDPHGMDGCLHRIDLASGDSRPIACTDPTWLVKGFALDPSGRGALVYWGAEMNHSFRGLAYAWLDLETDRVRARGTLEAAENAGLLKSDGDAVLFARRTPHEHELVLVDLASGRERVVGTTKWEHTHLRALAAWIDRGTLLALVRDDRSFELRTIDAAEERGPVQITAQGDRRGSP